MTGKNGTNTISTGEYRPCIVDGSKALFHRWVNKEFLILKFDTMLKKEFIEQYRKVFEDSKIVPSGAKTEKQMSVLGLVEFEDGTIKEVIPTSVKFLDSGNLFYENALFFREE